VSIPRDRRRAQTFVAWTLTFDRPSSAEQLADTIYKLGEALFEAFQEARSETRRDTAADALNLRQGCDCDLLKRASATLGSPVLHPCSSCRWATAIKQEPWK
jgi:hypothetical protein